MNILKKYTNVIILLLGLLLIMGFSIKRVKTILENTNDYYKPQIEDEDKKDDITESEARERLLSHLTEKIGASKEMIILTLSENEYINGYISYKYEVRMQNDISSPIISYYNVTLDGNIYENIVITDDVYRSSR